MFRAKSKRKRGADKVLILTRPAQLSLSNDTIVEGAAGRYVGTYAVTYSGYSFAITSDPDDKFALDGADLVLDNSVSAGTHSVTVRASKSGKPNIDLVSTITFTALPAEISYGWDASRDAGTAGDYFVATTGNDSTGTGAVGNPWRTVQKAVTAAAATGSHKTIKIRSGTYREKVTIPNTFVGDITGYGTEKPIISAADALTSWTQCDSGDEADVGSNYANIYKKTVANSSFVHGNAVALNLHENGAQMYLATDKPDTSNPIAQNDLSTFHTADSFVLSGSTIVGVVDPDVFGNYTEAQLLNSLILVHRNANLNTLCTISAYDSGTGTVTIGSYLTPTAAPTYFSSTKYSLLNILPAMEAGWWGYKTSGANTTIYVWPDDTGNLTANMEYSTRNICFNIDRTNNLTISDIHFRQASGYGNGLGAAISTYSNAAIPKTGITIYNCKASNCYSAGDSYGVFWLRQIDNLNVKNCTIDTAPGHYGIFCHGTNDAIEGYPTGGYLRFLDIVNVEDSPVRVYGQWDFILAFSWLHDSGYKVHANKFNFYIKCDNVLVWGVKCDTVKGYATPSESSRIVFAMSQIPGSGVITTSSNDNRAIVEQSAGGVGPTNPSDNYLFNLDCPPNPNTLSENRGSIVLGDAGNSMAYSIHNTIAYGAYVLSGHLTAATNNVWTKLRTQPSTQVPDATDVVETDLSAVYLDYANGDYSPADGSSPIVTTAAKDLETSGLIAALQARFPNFQYFDRDMNFVQFDWSSPFIGPDSTVGA